MGMYNILEMDFFCPKCKHLSKTEVEFNVGILNLETYHLGDKLRFPLGIEFPANNDPITEIFDDAGYVEYPKCEQDYFLNIVIENDVLLYPEIESFGWRKE